MEKNKYYYIRNAARILGLVASIFYLFIAYKGGLPLVMQGRGDGLIPFFPFLAIAVAGYMSAYAREKKGGYIMLLGGVSLFVFFLVYQWWWDWPRAFAYGTPFILCGAAFVYCSIKDAKESMF